MVSFTVYDAGQKTKHIMLTKITNNIFLSGADEVKNLESLNSLGIDTVFNVAYEITDPAYENILMIKIGIHEFEKNPDFLIPLVISTLNALVDNGRTVLVHCRAGAHRSPFIIFKYLADKQSKLIETLYQEFVPNIPWGIVFPPSIK